MESKGSGRGPESQASISEVDDLGRWLRESALWAEEALENFMPVAEEHPRPLYQAMRHALLAGGKRLRPAVVRAVCAGLGGTDESAVPAALAIELIHTYSLVHDDLPCMDDDDLRRGRPTVHVAYDEATAVLVGDALQALAFEALAGADLPLGREGVIVLAQAAGADGMVGGQVLDLSLEAADEENRRAATREAIGDMHLRKTAALFRASAELGALAAGASEVQRAQARRYGDLLGQAFQAVDDLLDVTGDATTLGKTPGKDAQLARPTLVAALGLEGARAEAQRLVGEAHDVASEMGIPASAPAQALLDFVLARRK
ncbi:MAG: farnesyl diphosphate synthase [Planctomycetota bacterium]|jgi:farnesyl diphosphate synthase